jgi:FixJ family two-component response regulator
MTGASTCVSASQTPLSSLDGVVFVVDGDVSVRESLDLLVRCAGWNVVTFATAAEFLSRANVDAPCCLVLDVELPDMSGMELQQQMSRSGEEVPTVFLTGRGDIRMTVRAMRAGAVEFLTKPFVDEDLLDAVNRAIERSHNVRVRDARLRTLRARYDTLSRRERQVMALVVSGLLNKQVAGELGLSEITVKAHRGQVMRKMNVDSLADLVRAAAALEVPLMNRSQAAAERYDLLSAPLAPFGARH